MAREQLSFEEVEIGSAFTSKARTLTETDLIMYSMLTGDWNPIHADAEYSKSTRAGARVFHGSFGIALALSMSAGLLPLRARVLAALGIENWAWNRPLVIGDTVHVKLTIESKRLTSDPTRAIIGRRIELVRHDNDVTQTGIANMMVALA